MRSLRVPLLVVLGLAMTAGQVEAQVLSRLPLSLHARLGAGLPTGGFAEGNPGVAAEPGTAFEVGAVLRVTPAFGVYGAYQQERFGCGGCDGVGIDDTAVTTGLEAGAELTPPFRLLGLVPWGRVGVVRHSLRFSQAESSLVSEPGVGFGVGGGVRIPVGPILLSPGVRYQSYSVDVEFSDFPSSEVDVSQLTVDVGLLLPF